MDLLEQSSPPPSEYYETRPRSASRPWASYLVTERDTELARVEGAGVTVEDGIREAARLMGNALDFEDNRTISPRRTTAETMGDMGALTVWSGYRCCAVLIPQLDGRARVVRIVREGGDA